MTSIVVTRRFMVKPIRKLQLCFGGKIYCQSTMCQSLAFSERVLFSSYKTDLCLSQSLKKALPATRNDIVDDFVTMRALDAIFATLKAIVDDIVTCGMAFRGETFNPLRLLYVYIYVHGLSDRNMGLLPASNRHFTVSPHEVFK